jgi:hypothetical protein
VGATEIPPSGSIITGEETTDKCPKQDMFAHNNLKDGEATCLALDKPIDNSSSIRASQMRWPLNRSLVPFCKIKKKSYENQKKKRQASFFIVGCGC